MTRTQALVASVLASLVAPGALAGCSVKSALYCGKHPEDTVNCPITVDGGVDGRGSACTGSADCANHTGATACDTTSGACVQCVDDSTCSGTAPHCGSDDACHACAAHADCASNACLDDGSCAASADVAFVQDGGSGSDCVAASPCGTLTEGLATGRPYVRLIGSNQSADSLTIATKVAILGDPGSSALSGTDSVFSLTAGADLLLEDLTISSQTNTTGIAVEIPGTNSTAKVQVERCTLTNNDGGAVVASSGTVTVDRSTIINNTGGGLILEGATSSVKFTVLNNFILLNGAGTSAAGGALLRPKTGSVFQFNTVVTNFKAGTGAGVTCSSALTIDNNLIAGNGTVGVVLCTPGTSLVQADTAGVGFVNETGSTADDFHLVAGSTAIDKATGSDDKVDFDGEARPNGSASDLGADEFYAH